MNNKAGIDRFFEERTENRFERNRTINIPDSVHGFYKNVANNFDVKLTSLISNILEDWKDDHGEELKAELIKRIKRRGF